MIRHHLVPRSVSDRGPRPAFGQRRAHSLDRLFDELRNAAQVTPSGDAIHQRVDYVPRVDIDESATEVRLSAELPGIDSTDVEVVLDGQMITLKGERKVEREESREGYYHIESTRGRFHRAIRLPFEPGADAVTASYKNGLLEITVAKPEEEQSRARVIPVTAP